MRRAVTGGEGGSGGGAGGVQTDGAGVGMARASGPEVPSSRAAMEIARMCCVCSASSRATASATSSCVCSMFSKS